MAALGPASPYFDLAYSGEGNLLVWVLGGIGALLGGTVGRRSATVKLIPWLSIALLVSALLASLLTSRVLRVDPGRDSGNVPLPWPWDATTPWLVLSLNVLSPLFAGFAVAALAVTREPWRRHWWCLPIAAYSLWVAPWALFVVFD